MAKIIMSWSKCKIEVGKTGDNDAMATSLTNIGTINDKSTTMSAEDGETLTATATGGIVVAEEEGEPVVSITTRVKEMSFDVENMFTGAIQGTGSDTDLTIKTNVVSDDFSLKAHSEEHRSGRHQGSQNPCFVPSRLFRGGGSVRGLDFQNPRLRRWRAFYKKFKVAASDWATV